MKTWQKTYDEGREPPAAFYDRPEIPAELSAFWAAFHELGSERQLGMGIGPIPWSAIISYADREGYNEDETDRFHEMIRRLDDEYLHLVNEKTKAKGKGKGKEPEREVSPEDTEGTREIFRNLMQQQIRARPKVKPKVVQ